MKTFFVVSTVIGFVVGGLAYRVVGALRQPLGLSAFGGLAVWIGIILVCAVISYLLVGQRLFRRAGQIAEREARDDEEN